MGMGFVSWEWELPLYCALTLCGQLTKPQTLQWIVLSRLHVVCNSSMSCINAAVVCITDYEVTEFPCNGRGISCQNLMVMRMKV